MSLQSTARVSSLRRPGAWVRYAVTGQGPAVLLLQGVGVPGSGWGPQVDDLRRDFTVVAVDNRGIDGGAVEAGTLTVEAMAADALAAMDAEKLGRFHLVGHSMGGLVAQELALGAPERVLSLSLLCTFSTGKQGARVTLPILVAGLRTRVGTRGMRRWAFLDLVMPRSYVAGGSRAAVAERLAALFGHDLADSPPVVMKQLRAMGRYDASARLARLGRLRTLVVSGALDRIALPRYGRALAEAIPGSRFVELEGAGHALPIQCAGEVNALLRSHFLAARP
jgi:aminoacrylate hydrolase